MFLRFDWGREGVLPTLAAGPDVGLLGGLAGGQDVGGLGFAQGAKGRNRRQMSGAPASQL